MKTLTLYRAYQRAESEKYVIRLVRRSSFGIAVNDDDLARRYQRYDRLAHKLDVRIRQRLGDETLHDLQEHHICWRCGYSENACQCRVWHNSTSCTDVE